MLKAFELSDWTKKLFKQGLRDRNPDLNEKEFRELYLKELERCHNRNY
jgi:hypothetical protein